MKSVIVYFCVSIFQIISFLTHIPTHTCKLALYLPFPIPFQMLFCDDMCIFFSDIPP